MLAILILKLSVISASGLCLGLLRQGEPSPGINRPEPEDDHSSPSSAKDSKE